MNEEAYLNKLVTYRLQFEVYKYDRLNGKLVEVRVEVSQRFLPMQLAFSTTSSQSELVINTIEKLVTVKGGAEIAIVSYILPLPTKYVEVHVVVVGTQVKELE